MATLTIVGSTRSKLLIVMFVCEETKIEVPEVLQIKNLCKPETPEVFLPRYIAKEVSGNGKKRSLALRKRFRSNQGRNQRKFQRRGW